MRTHFVTLRAVIQIIHRFYRYRWTNEKKSWNRSAFKVAPKLDIPPYGTFYSTLFEGVKMSLLCHSAFWWADSNRWKKSIPGKKKLYQAINFFLPFLRGKLCTLNILRIGFGFSSKPASVGNAVGAVRSGKIPKLSRNSDGTSVLVFSPFLCLSISGHTTNFLSDSFMFMIKHPLGLGQAHEWKRPSARAIVCSRGNPPGRGLKVPKLLCTFFSSTIRVEVC